MDLFARPRWVSPFAGMDLGRLLALRAEQERNRPFIVWAPFEGTEKTWTYEMFADDVARVSTSLRYRGITRGDRVLLHLENCPEFLLTFFALAQIGAVAVITNARANQPEIEYYARHSGAIAAVTQPSKLDVIEQACPWLRWVVVTPTDAGTRPRADAQPQSEQLFTKLLCNAPDPPSSPGEPCLPVAIQYTSGSTSLPKGVVWTHNNVMWGASASARHENLVPSDVHFVTMPLYHVIGSVYSVLASFWVGASVVLLPRFSASRFWEFALRHRCTWASLVPFCTRILSEKPIPRSHGFRRFGHAMLNSALERQFGVSFLGWWGMTELITQGIVSDSRQVCSDGAIGRPATEYQIVVLDERGNAVEPGATGELRIRGIRGLSLFQEYLDDANATREAFDEHGFFVTGDRMTVQEDGLLRFAGRIKDMLKVGGENVSALEIERVVLAAPEIREAAVVAKTDTLRGEVPVIYVASARTDLTDEQIKRLVLERCRASLADFKIPSEVYVETSLPRGSGEGKIAKGILRQRLVGDTAAEHNE